MRKIKDLTITSDTTGRMDIKLAQNKESWDTSEKEAKKYPVVMMMPEFDMKYSFRKSEIRKLIKYLEKFL